MSTQPVGPGARPGTRARARRRSRLAGGVLLTAGLVAAGAALLPPSDPLLGGAAPVDGPSGTPSSGPLLPVADDLLDTTALARLAGPGPWRVARTDANTSGTGINSVCQQRRFADPRGYAALVRRFRASAAPRRSAVQTVEVSRSRRAAAAAYETTLGWYAGCQVARLRVIDAHRVVRLGDRAQVLTLRVYDDPVTTYSVAVARTGAVTTTTVAATAGAPPPVRRVVATLGDAVRALCDTDLGGACVRQPSYRLVPPPPAGPGEPRGTLAAADLPPVGRVDRPWVGTRARVPRGNPAATTCDRADPRQAGAVRRRSRTYVVPQARLPERFGLTETYAVFRRPRAARAFLAGVRQSVAGCEQRDLATEVGPERRPVRGPRRDSSQWALVTTVAGGDKVGFRVGFVRVGRVVAQLSFTSAPRADFTDDSFGTLLGRAGERLGELRLAR